MRMMWKRHRAKLLVCALAMFVALNLIAYRHAWKMTHYAEHGVRTTSPDKLTTLEKLSVLVTGVTIPRPESLPAVDDEHVVTLQTADGLKLEAWDILATEQRGFAMPWHRR